MTRMEAQLHAALEALAQYDGNAVLRIKRMGEANATPDAAPEAVAAPDAAPEAVAAPDAAVTQGDAIAPNANDEAF